MGMDTNVYHSPALMLQPKLAACGQGDLTLDSLGSARAHPREPTLLPSHLPYVALLN